MVGMGSCKNIHFFSKIMSLNICTKLFDNFNVSWDPEKLCQDFPSFSNRDLSHNNLSATAYWQLFDTDVAFGRNFYLNFSKECIEVADKLKEIQSTLKETDNQLIEEFRKHHINPRSVNLIKTSPGKNIKPHKDITRSMSLNIGLKNSNKWKSFISPQPLLENFHEDTSISYVLEDGQGYLLYINNPHSATCLNTYDLISTRYVLTYTYGVIVI